MGRSPEYISNSVEETQAIAYQLAESARAGDIFCLCGQLGAGKTAFAQGFAKGLGYDGYVNSPTFTFMQMYSGGRLEVYHFDLYRLMDVLDGNVSVDSDLLEDIGFFEYLDAFGVCLIEWAECAKEFIPDGAIWIEIRRIDNDHTCTRHIWNHRKCGHHG